MMSEAAAVAHPDRRFRRMRVKPDRRRRSLAARLWRILKGATLTLGLIYAFSRLTLLVIHAPILGVDRILIHGNQRLSTGEILALLDGLRGSSILRTDLDLLRQRLQTSPWVRDAALRRVLPSTVEVAISERTPMGIGRLGSRLYLVDRDGTIIDEYTTQYAEFDLPIVDGLSGAPRDGGLAVDQARAALAARLLDEVRPREALARRVSQIDVRDARDAVVLLDGDTAQVHLGEDQFLERLLAYIELAPALRERVPTIDYVDLRFDDRVYVRPSGKLRRGIDRSAAAVGRRRF